MSPAGAFLLIVGVAFAAFVLIVLAAWLLTRNSGVRRRDYAAMRAERNAAWRALTDVEDAAAQYGDIDSALATKIRAIIRAHNEEKMEITR